MISIKSIKPLLFSSDYGDGKVLGQPLGVKTIGLVEVELDNNLKGYGEAYVGIYLPELFMEVVNFYSSKLRNYKFKNPIEIYNELYIPFCSRNGFLASVYAGIDSALWDVFCKQNGQSFAEINKLNIEKQKNIYWSGGSAAFTDKKIMEEINNLNTDIFSGYKLRIGRQDWFSDQKRIDMAKTKLSNNNLMVDAIMGTIRPPWGVKDWVEKSNFLNQINPIWVEEPLNPENLNDIKYLKKYLSSPIAFGEACTGLLELNSHLNCNELDILQLDFTHLGGPSSFLLVKDKIESSTKRVSMHIWGSPIAFNVNAYLGMCIKNCDWIEYPSVTLGISKYIDFAYFNGEPSLEDVSKLIGFSNFELKNIDIEKFKFVKSSGFSF